jgi:hypothetical protein
MSQVANQDNWICSDIAGSNSVGTAELFPELIMRWFSTGSLSGGKIKKNRLLDRFFVVSSHSHLFKWNALPKVVINCKVKPIGLLHETRNNR